ncbi:hypothetical protein LX15_004792 [Streptoalloteichus tenebrarius]|uniref:Uncharacterized protein n=1 Tax=Streptoalloteichus tenebrarius (strain ATCC 17920 / DSM 40477 / JCM 4838 / CBS 697.72 / NBRC 16177 / NCIMB 11028 / NRRL B-12390 / A12253. 1 / ISP 5477) TaxID=1933 RepID=A0ABT1HZV8_STRSD|nr:hypothetical protein [Streptoalloteichus tenebrarius]BFF03132.1 hypothetical protein GCM10020241_48070 [Streptoalloteichus tenebrarius]
MVRTPLVIREGGRVLVDRVTLARISGRSVHTIRARCPIEFRHRDGRPLYDAARCRAILDGIPERRRVA